MIVPFSSFHGRALRHNDPYFVCRVTTLEMAKAVISAAEKAHDSIILSFILKEEYTYPLDLLIDAVGKLATLSATPCLFQVEVGEGTIDAELLAKLPVQLVQIGSHGATKSHMNTVRKSLPAHVAVSLAAPMSLGYPECVALVHEIGADMVSLVRDRKESVEISLKHTADAIKQVKVPVVIQADNLSIAQIKLARKAGVGGYYLQEAFTEAYTAGMRTGLRDRGRRDPEQYVPYAITAVSNTYIHYSSLITS